ncbi:MAG: hypothetical protein NWP35_00990 [Ilumatobacteraceae bacterium]|nr:hypothetical protein [Ilumatobacteraceae bacterium]
MRIHPLISTVVGERALRPISAISVISAVGTVLSPALFQMPLVLSMLSPRLPFLLLAAGGTNPVLFVTLIGLRLSITDWHWFDLGRRRGRQLAMKSRISRKILMWNPRAQKVGVVALLAIRPISRHLLLSGMVGLKLRTVAFIDVISTVVFLVAIIMTVKGLR